MKRLTGGYGASRNSCSRRSHVRPADSKGSTLRLEAQVLLDILSLTGAIATYSGIWDSPLASYRPAFANGFRIRCPKDCGSQEFLSRGCAGVLDGCCFGLCTKFQPMSFAPARAVTSAWCPQSGAAGSTLLGVLFRACEVKRDVWFVPHDPAVVWYWRKCKTALRLAVR